MLRHSLGTVPSIRRILKRKNYSRTHLRPANKSQNTVKQLYSRSKRSIVPRWIGGQRGSVEQGVSERQVLIIRPGEKHRRLRDLSLNARVEQHPRRMLLLLLPEFAAAAAEFAAAVVA